MKWIFSLAVAALMLAAGAARGQDVSRELRDIMSYAEETSRKIYRDDFKPPAADIDKRMARLTQLIRGKEVNDAGRLVAYFLRAEVRNLRNAIRFKAKQPYDVQIAKATLDDYDKVIAGGRDVGGWFTLANVNYLAGLVARNDLKSSPLGYAYWQKCSDLGHPGCMNTIAVALLTGTGNIKVDPRAARDLNEKVYETGTQARCAGAYSGRNVGLINHFLGVKKPGDDPLAWFERAYKLLDQLEPELKTKNPCGRGKDFEAKEYLLRLQNNDRKASLLQQAIARTDDGINKTTLRYLADEISETVFREALAKGNDYERCTAGFLAYWLARIRKEAQAASYYLDVMNAIGPDFCGTDLVYAKALAR